MVLGIVVFFIKINGDVWHCLLSFISITHFSSAPFLIQEGQVYLFLSYCKNKFIFSRVSDLVSKDILQLILIPNYE